MGGLVGPDDRGIESVSPVRAGHTAGLPGRGFLSRARREAGSYGEQGGRN